MTLPRLTAVAVLAATTASIGNPVELLEQASSYWNQRDWQNAAVAYGSILEDNPYHGVVWHRYGFALHSLGRYPQAIPAFMKSIELGVAPATSMYNIACGNALLGNTDEALEWLQRAVDEGFAGEDDLFRTDSDLDALRDDPRFKAITGIDPPEGLTRAEAWAYDLDFLARRMEQVHYDLFGVMSRDRFEQAIGELKAAAARLTDSEIALGIQRVLAMVGDGHTHLLPPPGTRRLPIVIFDYTDGVFVQVAAPEYRRAVGARVVAIGDTPIAEAWKRVAEICSRDNDSGLRASVARHLVIPEILAGLGLIESADAAPVTLEDEDGTRFTVTFGPVPFHWPEGSEIVRARDSAAAPVPLWLKRQDNAYWFEYLGDENLVYFQFNLVRDQPHESIAAFCDRLFTFIENNPVDYLVIDMRHNGGGNNFLNRPLVHGLIRCDKINQKGRLFVIADRHTFSAAMNCVADIENHTEALFVGEPTGSRPNFVGETTLLALPISGLKLTCSSLYWQRSHAFDGRTWIAPDLMAEMSSNHYRNNRDPALEAVLAFIRQDAD